MLSESTPPLNGGKNQGDSTIAQSIDDVREKAKRVTLNKDGTPRKKYTRAGSSDNERVESVSTGNRSSLGIPGFTEDQVKAVSKGLFSMAALSTDCNVWFLSDDEADCFVPSSTLALNQTFPSVAQSKWGAISLAALALMGVVIAKTLVYMQYKANLKRPIAKEGAPANPANAGAT